MGWIHNLPVAGTVALYRCYDEAGGDHFVSPDPGCETHTVERLLGYAVTRP